MAQTTTIPTVNVSRSKANNKNKFVIGGLLIILAISYLIYSGVQSSSAYFLTVDELYAKGAAIENRTVRVTGKVDAETISFNNRDLLLTFDVLGENGQRMPVIFNGPQPDQMRDGIDAILEGQYDGDRFTAQSLLLKCPSRYDEHTVEEVQVEAIQ